MPITIQIFARNFTCPYMIERRIFMHKISQAYIVLAYGKPFITELFELPSYRMYNALHACASISTHYKDLSLKKFERIMI